MSWLLTFPLPAPLINLNDRKSWRQKQPDKTEWRDTCFYVARDAINRKVIPPNLSGVALIFDFPVRSIKIRRDPHNFAPTVKAAVDGMVTADLFVDDSADHVTVIDSQFHPQSDNPNVIVHIRKRHP